MASAEQLKALLQAHIEGDDGHFLAVAMQVAAHEAKLGHGKLAEELKDLVDAAKARRLTGVGTRPTPISQPRGELASLLAVSYPKLTLSDMILGPNVHDRLSRIIKEHRQSAKIRSHGLVPKRKLLLVGPPGTGKTMTASVLAGELGMPLFQVRLDGLISKFMGETASKLRLIFQAVAEQRGIYFFDEFDAIASQRGMMNDVGEIRRVLNSFLQFIEQDESNSLIVAATNHPEILDYAVFRRFDVVIEYGLPTKSQIIDTLKTRLSVLEVKTLNWAKLADEAAGLSFADLTRAADDATKDAIIHDRRLLTDIDVLAPIAERRVMQSR
jgi:SpoVK/Ycf46/Vps4 family AAA+-type ATPase